MISNESTANFALTNIDLVLLLGVDSAFEEELGDGSALSPFLIS